MGNSKIGQIKKKAKCTVKRNYTSKYNQEILDVAVGLLKEKKISSYQAEKTFGIPRRTLLDKVHEKHPLAPGCPTRLTAEEEKNIIKVLIAAGEYGSPLTLLDLRIVVHKYLIQNGRTAVFNDKLPGKKWSYSFIKRYKNQLSQRTTQNIKRSRAEKTTDEMVNYFNNLERSLDGIPKENILNYDETNLSDNPGSQKCLFRRGVKYPERVLNYTKGAISVMFAITAGGECLPPYIVYKAEHLYEQWRVNGPKGARYNRSKSGWFDSTVFEDWFEMIILPWAKEKIGPKILIGDNLASHINHRIIAMCEANDIRFVFLPPNSSHITQPLDVCYFGPLKKLWRANLLDYKTKNPREATINKSHFPDLLKRLMQDLNQKTSNILSAFKSTGIHPLNPDKVINKLPDSIPRQESCSIDNALLQFLKENRAPDPMKKVRNKKIHVPPGKSVTSLDFKVTENVQQTKRSVTVSIDEAGTSGSKTKTHMRKKKRLVRKVSSSSTECSEQISLASSTEDLIFANEQFDDNSDDELPLTALKSNLQSFKGNLPVDNQLKFSTLTNSNLQNYTSRDEPVGDKVLVKHSEPKLDTPLLSAQSKHDYSIEDYVIVRWDSHNYPGQITSQNAEGAIVNSMKKGKYYWRWPLIRDEQLYSWENVVQRIGIPKFVKKGCFTVPELDGN